MFVTKDEAPAEFMQRYQRIMDGKEKLETVKDLKDFWLLMLDQGTNAGYEARAAMADMAFSLTPDKLAYSTQAIKSVYIELECYRVITFNKDDDPEEYERISDTGWRMLRYSIDRVKVPYTLPPKQSNWRALFNKHL